MFETSIRGPKVRPEFIASLILPSMSPRPPTVRIVVTPESSSVFAKPRQREYTTALLGAKDMSRRTLSAFCFLVCFGIPEPGRCT